MHITHVKPVLKVDKFHLKSNLGGFFRKRLIPVLSFKLFRSAHSKRFLKEYSLALAVTLILTLLFAITWVVRASERSSLADWFYGIAGQGEGYSTLLSKDKTDEFTKNDVTGERIPDQNPVANNTSSASNPGSFTVNPSGSVSSSGGTTPPTTPTTPTPTPPVFSASISYFRQDSETLECPPLILNKNRCSKRYVFSAGIRTLNGPGAVNYSWQSNLPAASQSGSYSAGGGEAVTPLQKEILLSCKDPGNYTLQMVVSSPTQTQSGVLTINHVCNF